MQKGHGLCRNLQNFKPTFLALSDEPQTGLEPVTFSLRVKRSTN